MEEDDDILEEGFSRREIFEHLPKVKRDIAHAYMKNNDMVRETFKVILDREMTEEEKDRTRKLSFNMAEKQVAKRYERKLLNESADKLEKIPNKEMN